MNRKYVELDESTLHESETNFRHLLDEALPHAYEERLTSISEYAPEELSDEEAIDSAVEKKKASKLIIDDEPGFPILPEDTNSFERAKNAINKEATIEQKKLRDMSTIMEAILLEQMYQNNWLTANSNYELCPTHVCDDVLRATDLYLEYSDDEGSSQGLGIDITFARREKLYIKLQKTMQQVRSGKLSELKYIPRENEDGDFERTAVNKIPRIILTCDRPKLTELIALWTKTKRPTEMFESKKEEKEKMYELENELKSKGIPYNEIQKRLKELKSKYTEEKHEAKEKLRLHEVQLQLLYEAQIQLEAFIKIANHKEHYDIIEILQSRLDKINGAIVQKIKDMPKFAKLSVDHFYRTDETFKNMVDILNLEIASLSKKKSKEDDTPAFVASY
ncbi:MAG: hypothetical protein COX80_03125 [Candidatus Magasanikbacteria bacterium CG_4_10_14_0_2_um_filter_33_14]|uniref:Uncharacterized protein n=1 Tax=Candidatus Magasanikbacteria bacterium CG_4_10_14_0_2_um_filter_33_14 TaxID=1974636 RepID=A0A2M7VAB1_9BACT|nr:MAG: hypothetical protein COX80_03125 [Candidatus Magasanikbacteria bacterium CG_4_10_14_0_2_um_filter_33_14]